MIAINNSLPAFCNSDNTTRADSFDSQPQIYVICLASYKNYEWHGVWIDATQEVEEISKQISIMLSNSPVPGAEEYIIHNDIGFQGLEIEEDASIEDVHEKAMFILEHGELGAKLLNYYRGHLGYAEEAMESYLGDYDNELDYAAEFFNECYLEKVPETVRYYIDYESFKKDIFIDYCFSIKVGGKCHIFSRH
jgi:antirestriction protein